MRRCHAFLAFLILFCRAVVSGDAAHFLSIGFSGDERTFAFAQYGTQDGSGFPYAELYIVDVERNIFKSNGVIKAFLNQEAEQEEDELLALLEVFAKGDSLLKAFDIKVQNRPRTAVPRAAIEREHADWLYKGDVVDVFLKQRGDGELGTFRSSTAFQLTVKQPNKSRKVGNAQRFRKNVLRYDIDRVLTSPSGNAVIIVVRMTKLGYEGPDIRYMVETLILDN